MQALLPTNSDSVLVSLLGLSTIYENKFTLCQILGSAKWPPMLGTWLNMKLCSSLSNTYLYWKSISTECTEIPVLEEEEEIFVYFNSKQTQTQNELQT